MSNFSNLYFNYHKDTSVEYLAFNQTGSLCHFESLIKSQLFCFFFLSRKFCQLLEHLTPKISVLTITSFLFAQHKAL
jgi:hypothetical protein